MAASAFCLARSEDIARKIVEELEVSGFSSHDVSMNFPNTFGLTQLASEQQLGITPRAYGVFSP
jgi:hypothetical protein